MRLYTRGTNKYKSKMNYLTYLTHQQIRMKRSENGKTVHKFQEQTKKINNQQTTNPNETGMQPQKKTNKSQNNTLKKP